MASIPGTQYTVYSEEGYWVDEIISPSGAIAPVWVTDDLGPVNVITTPDGRDLSPPTAGQFNLEVITGTGVPAGLPSGYQGVAVLSNSGQTVDMAYGDYALHATGSSTVIGGAGNDTIYGGDGRDLLIGGSADDLISGGNGQNTIVGGSGADFLIGGIGKNTIIGGSGADTIFTGRSGGNLIIGGSGPDDIFCSAHDTVFGGAGADTIVTGQGAALIYGGAGPDLVYNFGRANDTIIGGSGPETIYGGSGHNLISAGSGGILLKDDDSPIFGAGGQDTVVGFNTAHGDAISFSGESAASINHVVATASVKDGNTAISLPDGSTMILVGITHIDHTLFR